MILIFEGPDGGGKSTLAKLLAEQTGWPLKSFSYPRTEAEKSAMFDMYSEIIYSNTGNLIIDRSWYSEMVYGPLMRKEYVMKYDQMHELEDMVNKHGGGIIVYCTAPMQVLYERLQERGDDYIPIDRSFVHKVLHSYEILMHDTNHKLPVVRYEYVKGMFGM